MKQRSHVHDRNGAKQAYIAAYPIYRIEVHVHIDGSHLAHEVAKCICICKIYFI